MTYEEQKQYNSLPDEQRQDYDYYSKKHPNWCHNQVMCKVAIEKMTDIHIDEGPTTVNPNDEVLWKMILKGAKDYLQSIGCVIREVFDAIDQAVNKLTGWITRRASNIVEEILDSIF